MFQKNIGLLIYGSVGTGKSFAAACIANALIDRGHSCQITSFSRIINTLWGASDKQSYLDKLNRHELLIIDDLSAERDTEYANFLII